MCAGFTGGTFPGANFPFAENFTSIIRGTASLYNWFSGPPTHQPAPALLA